jgi:tellurium resistance protein TerD
MVNVMMKSTGAYDRRTVMNINQLNVQSPRTSHDINTIHTATPKQAKPVTAFTPTPTLVNTVQKGQKVPLENGFKLSKIQARLGWKVTNPACDVDVSAFLLGNTGKVIGDDWFVFYGQTASPDNSTTFTLDGKQDKEIIEIDFARLNPNVSKIVFVLTINEALEKKLNFSMVGDAYVRIINSANAVELVSFKMDEYYSSVTSMMIGEIYQHNGNWKFNAIGNGVARDLAGLCKLYGVEVI